MKTFFLTVAILFGTGWIANAINHQSYVLTKTEFRKNAVIMLNDAAFMDYVFHGKVALDAGPEENFTKVGIMLQNYAWMLDEADLGGTLDQQKALQNDFCNFVIRAPVKSLIGYRFDVKTWGQNIQEHLKACGIRMP